MTPPRLRFLLLLLAAFSLPAAAQESSESVIARAGDRFISEKEFLERFEMLPGFGRHRQSQLETAKLELLYSLIAEKLLAQGAVARGLEKDSSFLRGVENMRKLLARDELYRREIIGKVSVPPRELTKGLLACQRQLLIRYVFFGREEDALFIRRQMLRNADFAGLQIDSSFHAIRDTVTLVWGEGDARVEEAAFLLKEGEISRVTSAGSGYYVMTLSSSGRNAFYADMMPDVRRERVLTILRRRRERIRLDAYVREILRDKVGYALPSSLRVLSLALAEEFRQARLDSVVYLTADRAIGVAERCRARLADSLAVAGTRLWSIQEGIDHLVHVRFGVPRTALSTIAGRLNTELKVMVQQELLGEEALRRGLDTVPSVRRQLGFWIDAFLSGGMRDAISRSVAVSDAEAWSYLHWQDTSVVVPQVQIRELRTHSYAEMQSALAELGLGASFKDVIARWSTDSSSRALGGLSPYFPVTARPPIGRIASQMAIGQRFGPVDGPDGVLYFELAGKTSGPAVSDTLAGTRLERARVEARESKARRVVTLFLADMGKEKGVEVYSDRLRMLKVSPIPMMTFRILGFGGRIPAVPIVQPELDWLDENGAKGTAVP